LIQHGETYQVRYGIEIEEILDATTPKPALMV